MPPKVTKVDKLKARLDVAGDETSPPPSPAVRSGSSASLNPHMAVLPSQGQSSTLLDSKMNTVSIEARSARNVIIRERSQPAARGSGAKKTLSPATLQLSVDKEPAEVSGGRPRGGSGSSSSRSRMHRIADGFAELERLLSPKGTRRTRRELLEDAVALIRELQVSMNEAGDQNRELNDCVEQMERRKEKHPCRGSQAAGPSWWRFRSPEVRQAWKELTCIERPGFTDLLSMGIAALLANTAPAEWHDPLNQGVTTSVVRLSVRSIAKFVLRMIVCAVVFFAAIRLIDREKLVVLRWLLLTSYHQSRNGRLSLSDSHRASSSASSNPRLYVF
ncbi:hypothetical protein DIPPA_24197 [Diplonema papillatum]|nr:hypothetical protein DIPPA_24197 [Diplonema papillatum]